jgi:hypothetical protein
MQSDPTARRIATSCAIDSRVDLLRQDISTRIE